MVNLTSDASGRCTPGKNHDDCDNSCGDACELYVQQDLEIVCPHVCFSGCYCPPGLVTFRERCVDPLECWSLLEGQCTYVSLHRGITSIIRATGRRASFPDPKFRDELKHASAIVRS